MDLGRRRFEITIYFVKFLKHQPFQFDLLIQFLTEHFLEYYSSKGGRGLRIPASLLFNSNCQLFREIQFP